MKIGTNDISKIYLGGSEISKIMLGTSQVYSGDTPTPPTPTPYDEQYLTIESTSDNNTIYWKKQTSNAQGKTISASTDNGTTWTAYTSTSGQNGTTIATLNSGDTIIFKGENAQYASQGVFKSTSSFIVYGNIMSLLYVDNFLYQDTLTSASTFSYLFGGCSGLTSAENLVLPSIILTDECYCGMFSDCTSLTVAPELPAITLADYCYGYMFAGCTSLTTAPSILSATPLESYCYSNMFQGCSSLTTAPELPVTTLADGCYTCMFYGCTSLTTAPVLSATTLADDCYSNMFYGCTNLSTITCYATDISASNCTHNWVDGVNANGNFFVPSGNPASWKCGVDGVPSDWVIRDNNLDTYECSGGGAEPSTDAPLDNSFAFKSEGNWNHSFDSISSIDDIEMHLENDYGLQLSDIEELVIGNNTNDINLDGYRCTNCTGLTLAPNVIMTSDIHNFPAMEWVNVMSGNFEYEGMSGLFSDMNCCPVYVPEESLSYYQSRWSSETTMDCQVSVGDRLVGWNNPDEIGFGDAD